MAEDKYISVGEPPASSGGEQLARLSGGYQSPTESSLRQDAGDAQRKAPMAPRIPASRLPVADLNSGIVAALMAAAALLCLLAVSLYGRKTEMLGLPGVRAEYETKLFDTNEIIRIDIQMDEEKWDTLLSNAVSEEYYVCDVVVNGVKIRNAAIRPKGNTSLSAIAMDPDTSRFSLKLEFDHFVKGQTCFGLDKLILNNNYADASNMKEAVVYDMYQFLDADASLYNYAEVSVNGEYWGIYLALEGVEESFMLRRFGTQDGELYKPDNMELADSSSDSVRGGTDLNYSDDNPDSYAAIWEGEMTATGKAEHRRVVTALRNISKGTDIEKYLDTDNVLKYMAVHTFAVNMDSLSGSLAHNYYLYEYRGQLNLIPWDYNLSFGGMPVSGSDQAVQLVNDAIDTPFPRTNFFDALLLDDEYREKYHAYLRQLVDEYVNSGRFDEVYNRIRNQIDTLVETDPTAFYSGEEYRTAARMLHDTIFLRAKSIDGQLKGTIPSTDSGQRQDPSGLVDASAIDIKAMGQAGNVRRNAFQGNFRGWFEQKKSVKDNVFTNGSANIPGQQTGRTKTGNLIMYGICFGIMAAALFLLKLYKRRR